MVREAQQIIDIALKIEPASLILQTRGHFGSFTLIAAINEHFFSTASKADPRHAPQTLSP
jgi:hypothetical protein